MCCRVLGGVYCSVIDRHSISIHHPPPACCCFCHFFLIIFTNSGYWWWLGSREWWKKREKGERRADETYYSSNSSISTRFLFRLIVERVDDDIGPRPISFPYPGQTNKEAGGGKYAIVVRAVNKGVVIVGWLWKSGIETFFDGRDRPEVGTAITADDGLQWQ